MTLPGIVICALLLALFGLAWHHWQLRRRLEAYAQQLRALSQSTQAVTIVPANVAGLESLASAIHAILTSLNQRQATVEAERDRLANIIEQLADGVLIADAEGITRFVNPAARRIFGQTEAATGRSVPQILRHHRLIEIWKEACAEREMRVDTVEWPQRRLFLQLIVVPDRHVAGGSLLLVQDLTRVRHLETVRRDFVNNFAHELRTPLAAISALAETLQDGALEDATVARRFLEQIRQEVDILNHMTAELLALARLEAGQEPVVARRFAPRDLLQRVHERMRFHAERAGLAFHLECPATLPSLYADDNQLERVLVNLLHNAIKFTPAGGEVTLLATLAQDGVRFAVRDTGIGIPAEDLTRIFERFYRVDRARSGEGSGLGLAIARHLVEANGSKLEVESVEGRGSTFSFVIPLPQESVL